MTARDLTEVRADFPILNRSINGHPMIYLDSAATALKPRAVVDAVTAFYLECTANIHRAVHALSEEATAWYEHARQIVARFLNADSREVAFVRNATEAINTVAHTLRDAGPVAFALSEHHSNQIPWRNDNSIVLPITHSGALDLSRSEELIRRKRPGLVTMSHLNNAVGVRQPVEELARVARSVGSAILLDVSQTIGHESINVHALDCDYLCFSGHKMLGPSGVGVLFQREDAPRQLNPLLLGGAMVHEVHRDAHEFRPYPWCIEAGTPNIEGTFGLAAACQYLESIGLERIQKHVGRLARTTRTALSSLNRVRCLGEPVANDTPIVTFTVSGMDAHGVARILSNRFGIIVRSGFHCCQPLHEECGFGESVRASFHVYNTLDEVNTLVEALATIEKYA